MMLEQHMKFFRNLFPNYYNSIAGFFLIILGGKNYFGDDFFNASLINIQLAFNVTKYI